MPSTRSITSTVGLRSCRLKRISAPVSLYRPSRLLLLSCVLGFFWCRPAAPSVGLWPANASTSFAFVVLITLPNTTFLREAAASEAKFDPDAAIVDSSRSSSGRSSSRKNRGVNITSSRRTSRGGTDSTGAQEKENQEETTEETVGATAGDVSSSETKRIKRRVRSQEKISDNERRQMQVEREEDDRKKREKIAKEMEDLLSDNSSWRKLQAKRRAEQELKQYADEEGHLDVESFDAWKEAYSKYKKQGRQTSALGFGAAASGAVGAAGLLGLLSNVQQKKVEDFHETRARRRTSWAMGAAGLLGFLGATASLVGRRHLKKMRQLSERRLTRMENEAYAGVVPRLKPTLGVDEIPEEEVRRRDREKRRQERQKR